DQSIDGHHNAMTTTELRRRRSRPMNHTPFLLFLLFAFIGISTAFEITANVKIHQDENGRSFILIAEGDSIEITCENFQGDHHWVLPNNTELMDVSLDDQTRRINKFAGHDDAEQKLTISNAKMTDTGLYGCKYEHHVEEDVYVFVRGPHFFLKSTVTGYTVDENSFTVPCRSTSPPLEEEGKVELYMGEEHIKAANKVYDPRIGFEITTKVMNGIKFKSGNNFECKYNGEAVNYIMTAKGETDVNYTLELEGHTEFPYVGGSMEYSCVVKGERIWESRFVHKVRTDCPRCNTNTTDVNSHLTYHNINEFRNITKIENLSSQDSGVYYCQWYMEQGDEGYVFMDKTQKQITVSTTKEQIKLINRTEQYIEIEEGQRLSIFALFRTFPDDKSIYSSKWKRLFVRAQKGVSESEAIINDDQNSINTNQQGRGILETLNLTKATHSQSGIYVLEVAVHNVTRRVEWQVRVKSRKVTPRIEIASQDTEILFDQSYYKLGSPLRVICFVESFPKPEVHLMMRKLDPQTGWEGVEGAVPIEGTYSKGYFLNVTANDDVEYKCEGRRKGEQPVWESKKVRVTDSTNDIIITWDKPDQESSESEEKKEIYEGDKITLECVVPKTDQVTMEWVFEKERVNLAEKTTVAAHSKHLIATIESATSEHSGKYTCVVRDEKNNAKNLTAKIEVTKTVKPYLQGDSIEPNVNVKYLDPIDLTCKMEGTPKPSYKWLKNGAEITDKSQISADGQRLHFPRAASQDDGTYTCQGINRAGVTAQEYKLKVKGTPKTLSAFSIFLIVLAFLTILGCAVAVLILFMRQKKKSKEQARSLQVLYEQLMRGSDSDAPPLPMHGKMTMDMRVRHTAYDPKYEIDMKNLVLLGALGSGQFGSVRKGRLARGAPVSDSSAYRGPSVTVAVKSPRNGNNPEDQKALIDELKILIAIDNLEEKKHPNVLSLVGAVTRNMKDGQLFVVFEMCENGDLKTFLQRYKNEFKDKFLNELKENKQPATSNDDYLVPNNQAAIQYSSQDPDYHADQERDRLLEDPNTLSTSDLISFSMQIASGMDFLAGVSCIHRDLAARNCLLNANRVVKIADFGMAKNEDKGYYRMNKTNVMVPYRWMAPESMEDHTFTVESDIWSYGIVLYEIFTLGSQPYPGVPNNNLHEHLKAGQRNPRPDLCHPDIYNLMVQTWDKDTERRPTFGQCSNFMRSQLQVVNPQMLESTDEEIDRNAAQIAQFDQFRGPRATAVLDEQELAALFAGQRTPVSNGGNDEETGERIYIKELRR
ncbi:hypothetical protein PMAYCL1PPCAC_30381, partial [Pristionchus mayeri]